MADPLSIAGSVVGITAAGVQASVKLYALAEKVATASQRVTSIADDISSTCAILNQVRELIIPQPDAQGTLKSVFNTVALNDISQALRRCRSSFTDIEALLRRAFEQVGKRPALRSNIKLSRFEQAKWPFLQPQFDELRNDLRDAKGNLVLMIAVASLALAQRDGRQRQIHETERLELGSTIVQLQRASTVKTHPQYSSKIPRREVKDSQSLSTSGVGTNETVSARQTRVFEMANMTKALPPGPPASEEFSSPSSVRAREISLSSTGISTPNVSLASVGDTQVRATEIPSIPHPSLEPSEPAPISPPSRIGTWGRQARAQTPSLLQKSGRSDRPIPSESRSLNPSSEWTDSAQLHEEQPHETTATTNDEEVRYHIGWTTDYLEGLATGYGNSVERTVMILPEKSLKALVKKYTEEGNDPHIAMSELTREQQRMITGTQMSLDKPELVYVRLERNIPVSSVFGTLEVETLKWVFTHTGRFDVACQRIASPTTQSPLSISKIVGLYEKRKMARNDLRKYEDMPTIDSDSGESTDAERQDPSHTPSSPEHSPLLLAQNEPDVFQEPPVPAVPLEGMTPFDIPYRVEEFGERDGYLEPPSIPHPGEDGSFNRVREEYQIYHPRPEWDATSSRPERTGYNTVRRYKVPDDGMEENTVIRTPIAEEDGEDIVNELLARWTTS